MPLDTMLTSAFGIMLGSLEHAVGWPMAARGSQAIPAALADYLDALGVEIVTRQRIQSLDELPQARAVLLNTAPNQLSQIAGGRLPERYLNQLKRYRYGPGVFKVDWALDGPIPWTARQCLEAGTVHVGGTMDEIVAAEGAVGRGEHPERPFIILAQQSLFDSSRAPEGKHTAWGYCHVPNGSSVDKTDRIEAQIERFAPGFGRSNLGSVTHPQFGRYGSLQRKLRRRRHQRWDPRHSTNLHPAAAKGCHPTRLRCTIYTSAPPPHRRAEAFTACVVTMRLEWR